MNSGRVIRRLTFGLCASVLSMIAEYASTYATSNEPHAIDGIDGMASAQGDPLPPSPQAVPDTLAAPSLASSECPSLAAT